MRGHAADAVAATKLYERVPKYTTVSFGMREYCPRTKSDSDSESDFSTRGTRGDNVHLGTFDKNTFIKQFVGKRFVL